ncbi:MAG TPA: histidine phosphatase family protein [Terracidiphilus sp.]|nr:histidine phosphatase family protein [Terracidiphilus sp.]
MKEQLVGLVARHGETDLNDQNCFRSWLDVPLNATGLEQARAAAKFLKKYDIATVISSPLLRAFVTADFAAGQHNLMVYQHRGLFPWRLGVFSGLPRKQNNDALRLFVKNPDVTVPGGESLRDFEDRQFAFWRAALNKARNEGLTLFVAHTSNVVALENMTSEGDAAEPEQSDTVKPGGVAAIYWNGKNHRIEPVFGQPEPAKFGGS